MSTARHGPLVFVGISALCATLWLLPYSGAGRAQEFPAVTPVLTIDRTAGRITITGDASSEAHRNRMEQLAVSILPELAVSWNEAGRAPLPAAWALITEMTLRAVATTTAANARITDRRVRIDGFTADKAAWETAVRRLQDSLLPDMELQQQVLEIEPGKSFDAQCLGLLQAVTARRRIEFSQSGAEPRSNSYALLDEVVEIAADCPAVLISVTGHTDGSGDAAINRHLSKARADAVVAYMVGKGIAASRLQAFGAGSTVPLAEETNARTRARNRRIEFEFATAARGGPGQR